MSMRAYPIYKVDPLKPVKNIFLHLFSIQSTCFLPGMYHQEFLDICILKTVL